MDYYINTCFIKKPFTMQTKKKNAVGFSFVCLWIIASLLTSAYTDVNARGNGFTLVFKIHEAIALTLSTLMLTYGLTYETPYWIIPWLIITTYNMVFCQYPSLFKIVRNIGKFRTVSSLLWFAFALDFLSFVVKSVLIGRVAYLGMNIWYQNKLERETLRK